MSCTLSLCMIAKNEEHQITRCINSAKPFVDQIIVVDTGSTDNTVQIARGLGAEVYQIEWQDDFSQARNKSLEHARGDWILFLDCDEELDQNSAPVLREVIKDEKYDSYWLQFINIYNNKPSSSFLSLRLFRNNPKFRFECLIHEQILPSIIKHSSPERIGQANVNVYHYGYENSEIINKNKIERNIRILNKARDVYGDAGFINFYLGVEHQRIGDYPKALEYYTASLSKSSLKESYTPAMVRSIIQCLINLQRFEEALNLINQYLNIYPDYTDLMYIKGILYSELGKYNEALDCMNQCIVMGPPPNHYFSIYGISDKKPKESINTVVQSLIAHGAKLIKHGFISEGFSVLETVFSQLKKTPDEDLYINLTETMLALSNTSKIEVPEINHIQYFRQREFEARQARLNYIDKQRTESKGCSKCLNIHVVYLLGHVSVCGGVKIILEHANQLNKHGVRVTLLSHFPKPDWYKIDADYKVVPFGIELARGIPHNCDVIVATYWDQIAACIEMCAAPVVYFEQGDFHLFSWDEVKPDTKEIIQKQYQLPSRVITVSETTAQKIKEIFGRNALVYHNALNDQVFSPKIHEPAERQILAVGSDHLEFKRIDDIWQACQIVRAKGFNIDFKWVTPNKPTKELGTVFVNPTQEELGDIYRQAWVYVSASEYESFSLPVLEAMACGTPVITTPNVGVRSYALDGENCLFFQTGNPQDLADIIIKLLEDPVLYKKLQVNGYKTAARFKWSEIIPKLKSFYEEMSTYQPVGINKENDWIKIKDVAFTSGDQQVVQHFLSGTVADIVFMPFTFNICKEFTVVRWYPVFERKNPYSGQRDYLYLSFKELPLSDYPYQDAVGDMISKDYDEAFKKFKGYSNETNDPLEFAVLIRWMVWCLIKTQRYGEVQTMIAKGIKYYPTYMDLHYLYSTMAGKFVFTTEFDSINNTIQILGDSTGFPEYIKNVSNYIHLSFKNLDHDGSIK